MPRIINAVPVPVRGRSRCILFLDEWPKGAGRERRGEVDGEVFELLGVMLDGGAGCMMNHLSGSRPPGEISARSGSWGKN